MKFYDFDAALRSAIRIGLTVCEFEELTPYQLNLMIKAYADKQKEQLEKDITVAYLNSMWTIQWLGKRHQHPKPLKEILASIGKEKKTMTDEQMLAMAKALNAALGGEVK